MSKISVELDEKVLEEAMRLTHAKTKKQAVNYALEALVKRLKRKKILELEGKVQFDYVR